MSGTETEVEQTPEQIAEANAVSEREAEAAISAGVAKTQGKLDQPENDKAAKKDDTNTEDKAAADAAAKATADAAAAKAASDEVARVAAEKAAAEDPWKGVAPIVRKKLESLDTLPGQISKLSGHVGSFKQALDGVMATAKAAAEKKGAEVPTKVEIEEAMADPKAWEQLQEDFPEWMKPVAAELTRLRKDLAATAKSVPAARTEQTVVKNDPIDTDSIVDAAEERAFVRLKHPDWRAICATPEFNKDWLPRQSDEIKAKASSSSADDAIAVFDAYKAHKQKLTEDAAAKLKNEERLKSAVTVKGSAEPPTTGISDEDAFNLGVKKVLRKA